MPTDHQYMRLALELARRGYGATSPNPMVGAVLVKRGRIIGRGWHRRAGGPHAEVEALQDARKKGNSPTGATLYVTLEPCSTFGRTPPCTDAILAAGIKRVVVGATDPNPRHAGKAFGILRRAGVSMEPGMLEGECSQLNEAFNHWIVRRTPWVTVKAAMTLDGKIATASGESKWITGEQARAYSMTLRGRADAILVGVNTILADDPSLTFRPGVRRTQTSSARPDQPAAGSRGLRRIILDTRARTPLDSKVVSDDFRTLTTIFVGQHASSKRVAALSKRVRVVVTPVEPSAVRSSHRVINLRWVLACLGREGVTSLLVEGGGEVNASFLLSGQAHRVAFFYAPIILGGRASRRAVAGEGARSLDEVLSLKDLIWRKLGPDLLLTARVSSVVSGRTHSPG